MGNNLQKGKVRPQLLVRDVLMVTQELTAASMPSAIWKSTIFRCVYSGKKELVDRPGDFCHLRNQSKLYFAEYVEVC